MILTPDSYTIKTENKTKRTVYYIDPMVHLLNDSDVWTLNKLATVESNKEILLKADDENLHGSGLDALRRVAVHSANVMSAMEKMSHEQKLKEEDRKSRNAAYS